MSIRAKIRPKDKLIRLSPWSRIDIPERGSKNKDFPFSTNNAQKEKISFQFIRIEGVGDN